MKIDMAFFPEIKGSMTSSDGKTFMLHVEQAEGGEIMLGFPHNQIPNILENAAMQAAHCKPTQSQLDTSAFVASGFQFARGPEGQPVLTMLVGKAGRISFLLTPEMPGKLSELIQKAAN